MQIFHLFMQTYVLFILRYFCCTRNCMADCILDGEQPAVFHIYPETHYKSLRTFGFLQTYSVWQWHWHWCECVKQTEDVLLHQYKYFFHLMVACKRCNDRKICLNRFTAANCRNVIFEKKTSLIGFFIIKTRRPDGLENKTDLGGENQQWEPWHVPWAILRQSCAYRAKACARMLRHRVVYWDDCAADVM